MGDDMKVIIRFSSIYAAVEFAGRWQERTRSPLFEVGYQGEENDWTFTGQDDCERALDVAREVAGVTSEER
jgi:hypothetical protein